MSDTDSMYPQQQQPRTFAQKCKDQPVIPAGILGTLGMIGWGIYRYKHRRGMSTSIYLMHLRVKAQSMVVGAMIIGGVFSVYRDRVKKDTAAEKK